MKSFSPPESVRQAASGSAPANEGRLDFLAGMADGWFTRNWILFLSAATLLCGLTFAGYSHAKQIWVDETLQMLISGQPTVQQTWDQLKDGYIQVDPPMLHVLQHFLLQWLGNSVQVMRLPAIFGFCLMCLSLAILVSRHAPRAYAAAAFFLPYATVLRSRAMDARPYGVLAGFTALTLLCWDSMQGEKNKTAWRVAFTLSASIMFCSHFYSVFFFVPLVIGEAARAIRKRRIDWAVPVCTAIALIPFALSVPVAASASRIYLKHYFSQVAFANIYDFYSFAVATLPIAGVLIVVLLAQFGTGRFREAGDALLASRNETRVLSVVAAGFLLIPVAGYIAGVLVTGFFVPYYHMMSVTGLIVGLPLAVSGLTGRNRLAGLCLFLAILGQGMFVTARGLSGFRRVDPAPPAISRIRALIPEPQPEIVVPSPSLFLPWHFVTGQDPNDGLVYLYDRGKCLAVLGTDSADVLYFYLKRLTNARIEPFDPWVASHKHFYMAVAGTAKGLQEWQYDYLAKQGHARFTWLGKVDYFDVYRVDTTEAPAPN